MAYTKIHATYWDHDGTDFQDYRYCYRYVYEKDLNQDGKPERFLISEKVNYDFQATFKDMWNGNYNVPALQKSHLEFRFIREDGSVRVEKFDFEKLYSHDDFAALPSKAIFQGIYMAAKDNEVYLTIETSHGKRVFQLSDLLSH